MRILSASVKNFGSYKELSFGLPGRGLTLISGPTGSGKSTLCDIIPWVLFGRTAKDGTADDVISWNAAGPTDGVVIIELPSGRYGIRRIRSSKNNDLFFFKDVDYSINGTRGKDLNDTQKLINSLLGLTIETYLAGAYFHEFSQTSQFFVTSAKNRRIITEQLADLALAKDLQDKSTQYSKELKQETESATAEIAIEKNNLNNHNINTIKTKNFFLYWQKEYDSKLTKLEAKMLNFESDKMQVIHELGVDGSVWSANNKDACTSIEKEIESLEEQIIPDSYFETQETLLKANESSLDITLCPTCGSKKDNHAELVLAKERYELGQEKARQQQLKTQILILENKIKTLTAQTNPYENALKQEKLKTNVYIDQLEDLKTQTNPFSTSLNALIKELPLLEKKLSVSESQIAELKTEQSDIKLLQDVIADFRGSIITRTIDSLEHSANKLLEDHFDAEIRVLFSAADADKIDVNITKDGNKCSYTQLSKGQRQILKLCFGVSVMKAVSNFSGVSFNTLWFDEATDGLSDSMKLKALGLLETLSVEYKNIFLVEHSEAIKTMINNKIEVSLIDGNSVINEDT